MTACTALIPYVNMDTQALTIIDQIATDFVATYHKREHVKALASIKATTVDISIEGAISILDVFEYANDQVCTGGQKWQARDLMSENYFPHLVGFLANQTPALWFWGGPPTRLKWYQGTLQTLLDDRILYEIRTNGAPAIAELIGLDLGESC